MPCINRRLCIFSRSSKKSRARFAACGGSTSGLVGFKASTATTAPAELTTVIRYCPVFKTVALTLFSSATDLTGYLAIGPTAGDRLNIHFVNRNHAKADQIPYKAKAMQLIKEAYCARPSKGRPSARELRNI